MIKVLSKREKVIFYATVGVIIFAVIFNFFIAPVLTKNDALNREIKVNRSKLAKYLWLLNNREAIQKKYSKFAPLGSLTGRQEDAAVDTMSGLENLAKNANVRIVDLRPQQAGKIDLRTEGSMENYLKFIYDLENSLLLLKIKKIQISSRPNTTTLEGNFSLSQFFSD